MTRFCEGTLIVLLAISVLNLVAILVHVIR